MESFYVHIETMLNYISTKHNRNHDDGDINAKIREGKVETTVGSYHHIISNQLPTRWRSSTDNKQVES